MTQPIPQTFRQKATSTGAGALRLVPYLGANPFAEHPQLQDIWPDTSQALAQEATLEAIQEAGLGVFCGIYLAAVDSTVVGMTGFFITEEGGDPFLRWHGVVPSKRGQGHSERMLTQLLPEIGKYLPNARTVTELIPQTTYSAYLSAHFAKLGFAPAGPLERYDWSEYDWQPWRRDLPNSRLLAH